MGVRRKRGGRRTKLIQFHTAMILANSTLTIFPLFTFPFFRPFFLLRFLSFSLDSPSFLLFFLFLYQFSPLETHVLSISRVYWYTTERYQGKATKTTKNEKENNFFFNLPFCKQNLFGLNTETFTERWDSVKFFPQFYDSWICFDFHV